MTQTQPTTQELNTVVEKLTDIDSTYKKVIRSFEELNLKEEIFKGIINYGFTQPSPIQARAIMPIIERRDVIAQAHSGTGKTATFVIAVLQNIDYSSAGRTKTQALVVSPTRELAQQTNVVFSKIGKGCNINCHAFVGGTSVSEDIEQLNKGISVVVGTPGRIYHMIEKGFLKTNTLKMIVLDEADEMLNKGFKDQIYNIFKMIPADTQVVVVSATMPETVWSVMNKFMKEPEKIVVQKEKLSLSGITQYYVCVNDRNVKVDTLDDIMCYFSVPQFVIFVNNQKDAITITDVLKSKNHAVGFIHAGLKQFERDDIMSDFRNNKTRCIIATDLISRGIDVQAVSLVINFDPPKDPESYIHRIGRSGRYGRKGIAITLVIEEEMKIIKELEEYYKTTILEMPQNLEEII